MLTAYTARISYQGPDRLDVTRKTGDRFGRTFAPSWEILGPALKARRTGDDPWESYSAAYLEEMRGSWRECRPEWRRLLAMEQVTCVCYCADSQRCHRTLLAGILGKLGARVMGERGVVSAAVPACEVEAWRREGWVENRQHGWIQRRGLTLRCIRCGTIIPHHLNPESDFVEEHSQCRRSA